MVCRLQFIQDPLDYDSRVRHTDLDTYDHLRTDDLRQSAVMMAAVLLSVANKAEPLPLNARPTQPGPTHPFAYPVQPAAKADSNRCAAVADAAKLA